MTARTRRPDAPFMEIRPYLAKDAVPLADLYARSVAQVGGRFYSPRQTAAWLSLSPSPERLHALMEDGRTRLVAVDEGDRPLAFADLERSGRIHLLYCAPEAAGRGIASVLYEALEDLARRQRMIRLHAEASEAARSFFVDKGFIVRAKRRLAIDGTELHNYAVEKILAGEPPP